MEIIVFQKKADLTREAATPNYLEDVSYSCGVSFQELDVPESLTCVYVLEHNCYDPVEPLYYTAGFDPICVYCAIVRCRTLVHQKIIPCVTVVKRKSPLSEDRLLSM